jgi:hypothetical protein
MNTSGSPTLHEEIELRLLDAGRESTYAYWNALLTLNGILISAFSAIAFFGTANKWLIFVLVAFSMLSAGLLIANYVAMKNLYKELGRLDADTFEKMSEQEKREDLNRAAIDHQVVRQREIFVLALLFIQAGIILSLFFV